MLEEEHFVVATLSQDEFSAIAADELIAEKLRLNTGAPILFKKRYVFDLGEPPIEYNLGYYKASRFVYTKYSLVGNMYLNITHLKADIAVFK